MSSVLGATSVLQRSKCPLLAYWAHFHPLPVSASPIWPQPCVLLLQVRGETKRENDSHQDWSKWAGGIGFSLAKGSFSLCLTSWSLFNIEICSPKVAMWGLFSLKVTREKAFTLVIVVYHGCVVASWLSEQLECGVVRSISSASSWGCYSFVALWSAFNMSARGSRRKPAWWVIYQFDRLGLSLRV